jgi:hypothetical protein
MQQIKEQQATTLTAILKMQDFYTRNHMENNNLSRMHILIEQVFNSLLIRTSTHTQHCNALNDFFINLQELVMSLKQDIHKDIKKVGISEASEVDMYLQLPSEIEQHIGILDEFTMTFFLRKSHGEFVMTSLSQKRKV